MSASGAILAVVSLWCLQDAKARYAEAGTRLHKHVWEERLELGSWCRTRGLITDAIQHYSYVRDKIAGNHPYKTQAIRHLAGSWTDKKDTAGYDMRDQHAKKCAEYTRKAADLSFECYKIARDGKLLDLAAASLRDTLRYDIDHPGAREERGEVEVEPFGWVPKDEVPKWKAAPRSENFAVYTDGPDAKVALDRLEQLMAAFSKTFKERFSWKEGRIGVVWLRDIVEFERIRARTPEAPAGRNGFYHHLTRVAYVLGDLGTLSHEATHAIVDVGAGSIRSGLLAAGKRADAPRDVWVIEGLALWFETLEMDKGQERYSGPDLPAGFSVDAFTKLVYQDFEKNPDTNYPLAHALVKRFMEDQHRREDFLDFVRDFYAGHGDSRKLYKP